MSKNSLVQVTYFEFWLCNFVEDIFRPFCCVVVILCNSWTVGNSFRDSLSRRRKQNS